MTIKLYSFSKRQNSTKQPLASDLVTTLTGELKSECSVLSPSVIIEVPTGVDLFTDSINYAYIPDLGRRYWISDIVLKSDKLAELKLTEDVLGSFKTPIGNSSQYVYRSASQQNTYITDKTFPITNNAVINTDDITSDLPWSMLNPGKISDGYYVIGITNRDSSAIGCVSYYVFDQTGFADLRYQLMNTVSYTGMTFAEIEEPLYKSLYNPFQYLVSCVWFPIKPPTSAMDSLYIYCGFFPLTPLASHTWRLSNSVSTHTSGSLNTVNHPQYSDGVFYNAAPYTQRKLMIQPYGEIELDCSKLLDNNHVIKLRCWIDYITGDTILRVFENTTGDIVGGSAGQIGVPLNIAQMTQNPSAIVASGLIGSINKFGDTLDAMIPQGSQPAFASSINNWTETQRAKTKSTISKIGNAALNPTLMSKGTNGSFLSCTVPALYETKFFLTTTPDTARFGTPLCAVKTINTLSGFIQCQNARFPLAGLYDSEQDAIESFMNAGFFYE